ncbi:MAG TPA: hypothetical protein DD400_03650 [Rhodospirillaceae bacterium]|nr:hypothetical protein [Rhodospirillaceae bacterium]
MNKPLIIFDFDGTLRDGLNEKVFAFQTVAEITWRLLKIKGEIREYDKPAMQERAGRPVGEIGKEYWHKGFEQKGNLFTETYNKVWGDLYGYYRADEKEKTRLATSGKTSLTQEEMRHISTNMPPAPWFEGTQKLVEDLYKEDFPVGILSNTSTVASLEGEVDSGNILPFVPIVHTGSPVDTGKPHGYALLHCIAAAWSQEKAPELLETLNQSVGNKDSKTHKETIDKILNLINKSEKEIRVLVVGDGAPDMEVAQNAREALKSFTNATWNIETLAVTFGFQTRKALEKHEPTGIVGRPEDMNKEVLKWAKTGAFSLASAQQPKQPNGSPQNDPTYKKCSL